MAIPLRPASWLLVAALALAGCGTDGRGAPPDIVTDAAPTDGVEQPADVAHGSWERVARSPLSPRNNAVVTWTGEEVLVFGGETFFCGGPRLGMLSCAAPDDPPLRDGAAYDPAADSWRRIAPAPVPMLYASTAVIDDTVYVLQDDGVDADFFAYDIAADRWRRLPAPRYGGTRVIAIEDHLVAYRATAKKKGREQIWDADAGVWLPLPPTPDDAVFERKMVDLDGRGVLTGVLADGEGNTARSGLAAAALDLDRRRWTELSYPEGRDADELVYFFGQPLHAAAGVVASAAAMGDRVNGHEDGALLGGILDLDRGWSHLPTRPMSAVEREARAERDRRVQRYVDRQYGPNPTEPVGVPADLAEPNFERFGWLNVGGDGFVVAGRWALDVASGTWQHVPSDKGPLGLYEASAVWAGDRVFAWGGSRGYHDVVATGWTWRPARSATQAVAGTGGTVDGDH